VSEEKLPCFRATLAGGRTLVEARAIDIGLDDLAGESVLTRFFAARAVSLASAAAGSGLVVASGGVGWGAVSCGAPWWRIF
jgi:hypothetical protein